MSLSEALVLCALISFAGASTVANSSFSKPADPYLQYRPEFARSLPIQILLTGIVLTLVSVLFIHLVFTAQYHWPLAPVNFVLQFSGVTSLLIMLFATLHVVLSTSMKESQQWPYMLSYIAVHVPSANATQDGSVVSRVTWSVMNAWTAGLTQITHIQFLTLLYPSSLEAALIFCLLVPLSVGSAAMELLLVSSNDQVSSVASAIHNVCNATLSLLFTVALLMWGLLVNRKQAWRLEGGTAVFGGAAMTLALVSTALNFLYVPREEEYLWLPGLIWAVMLWQSFFGWWWWVGAGSWCGLGGFGGKGPEEMILRMERREKQKRERIEKRKETQERAKLAWKGVAGAFSKNRKPALNEGEATSPSSPTSPTTAIWFDLGPVTAPTTVVADHRHVPGVIYRWYHMFRHAHQAAAREQTVEQAERIREINSISWWGPLRRWRLQNVTVYP